MDIFKELVESDGFEFEGELHQAIEKNEWIRAEIKFKFEFHLCFKESEFEFEEENNMDYIRLTDPYDDDDDDDDDDNDDDDDDDDDDDAFLSTGENNEDQPLLKNQKLLDAEDLDA
jgi:hypothetical protein